MGEAGAGLLAAMRLRSDWRTYQRMMLEAFDRRDPAKRTFHVVAPPGSGKTLVGLEIIRRVGRPAVTFSPTTTIQEQWRDKVSMFVDPPPPGRAEPPLLREVSTNPGALGVISCLTYQSLATQTEEREFLDRLGRQAWIDELVGAGREEPGAVAHVEEVRNRAPNVYREEVSRRSRASKRALLESHEASVEQLLHPNALALLVRLEAQRTGVIVLDEAHHLLDYWAAILARLLERVPDALVVGLTATPPASAGPDEMRNYLALVDGIDFEVPTPAVVRSGHLAPYQDLVLLTEPTPQELGFLRSQDALVKEAVQRVLDDPRFLPHLEVYINRPDGSRTWQELFSDEFDVAVAGVRHLLANGRELARDVEVLPEMRAPPSATDHLALVREWCMDVLRLSADERDRHTLADVRAALRSLGIVMTDTGWRPGPSPTDRVLAYSRSKVAGMVEILREEQESMGDRLRAVVLTDHERTSPTALRRLEGVLDPESGGAVQAIRALVADGRTNALQPVMVTGHTVLVDADVAESFLTEAAGFLAERGLKAALSARDAGPGLAEIVAEGPGWGPRQYVAFVTALFDRGVTRCIVGTRGLLSEGWDSLSLNTLVDLTIAGTFASVNQIRGRSIRLDPAWPEKVADNWDVVCVARGIEGGRSDLARFVAKHQHVWGLGQGDRIVKGVGHVDARIPMLLAPTGGQTVSPRQINQDSMRRARHRDRARKAWGIGQPYDNFEFRATVLAARELPFRTAFTWKRTLRRLLNIALANLGLALLFALYAVPQLLSTRIPSGLAWLVAAGAMVVALAASARPFWRYFRAAFLDLPVDSYLADFGRAVAEALDETGLASATPEQVRVVRSVEDTYEVHLDTRDPHAAGLFAQALQDLFRPVVDQRYLVAREETSLSGTFYKPLWYALRTLTRAFRRHRAFYHPVPDLFGRKRELAEAFGRTWARWVGGGALVYTRTPEGARILLRERAASRIDVSSAVVDEWR
jgi:Type III restriction enzyme, res subunit